MIIKKKRIRNISLMKTFIKNDSKIRIGLPKKNNLGSILKKIGFDSVRIGDSVLPKIIGPVTRRNAEGYEIIIRKPPKEKVSYPVEWTWNQWAGRGRTEEKEKYDIKQLNGGEEKDRAIFIRNINHANY